MQHMTTVALCLLIGGWPAHAAAQTPANEGAAPAPPATATRQLPVCTVAPDDPTRLAVEPCRPAPPQAGPARRAVPQIIQRMPPSAPPVAVAPARPLPPPAVPVAPRAPVPINRCDIGGCRDANGVRHEGGVGNVTIGPGGRQCVRNGAWLQCS